MSPEDMEKGRIQQKLRTRKALVEAAWQLLQRGKQPTVAEAAEKALVSRATAYRYFPNRERLLIEAVLDRRLPRLEQVEAEGHDMAPGERAAKVQGLLFDQVANNETLHRLLMRASIEEWLANPDKSRRILRGDQRLPLLEWALEAAGDRLDSGQRSRLLYALTTMVSFEPYLVLRDVCQLSPERSRETMAWAVRTLVEAALERGELSDQPPVEHDGEEK